MAVTAAAHAVEAEKRRVLGGEEPKERPGYGPHDRANKGDFIGQLLVEHGVIGTGEARDVGRLFSLRNNSVHPDNDADPVVVQLWREGRSPSVAKYTAVTAAREVALAETIVTAIGRLGS